MESHERVKITRILKDSRNILDDDVVTESPLTIFLNGEELVTIICTPENLVELAVGYLYSEGIIHLKEDIISYSVDEKRGVMRLDARIREAPAKGIRLKRFITPGCSFYTTRNTGAREIESKVVLSTIAIRALIHQATVNSILYRETGGVHSAALCAEGKILFLSEDIGRHNAVDKILGRCLLEGISTEDRLLITSGRISSALMAKVINARIPFVISSSAPTAESIRLAKRFGVTLIGFARGQRLNIYSNEWRVKI